MKYEKYYRQFLETNPHPRFLRSLEVIRGSSSIYVKHKNKKIINFSSSDYLGLSNHPLLIQRSHDYAKQYGTGSSASRLVSGNFDCYAKLESDLAKALNKPAALILGSGYQTNQSVLEVLFDPSILGNEPVVLADKLCHTSMLSGMKSLTRLHRFRHNDLTHLKKLLDKYAKKNQPLFIVAESIYSMEGDQANLSGLTALANQYEAFLYIDDAHSTGIYGKNGWGNASEHADDVAIIMGTFSKAMGSFGGFIGCSETIKQYLINKCKGLIYSTALSPAVLGAIDASIELIPQMQEARLRLKKHTDNVRAFFREENLDAGESSTHIIPWIIGHAPETLHISQLLEEQGILATGIQPPSVPPGKSRIRFCLSAAHTDEDIQQLCEAIHAVHKKL